MRATALARLTLVLLVVATVLAIFYAQELKQRGSLLIWPKPGLISFKPAGPLVGPTVHRFAHFRVKASIGDTLEVAFVDEASGRSERVIKVLVHQHRHEDVSWDGRNGAGALAPPGVYLIEVHFVQADRTVQARLTLRLLGPGT